MNRFINACIWIAAAIMIVGFLAVLAVGMIGKSDQTTRDIVAREYPIHDVKVDSVSGVVSWTTNDNRYNCFGAWIQKELVKHKCKEVYQTPNEELGNNG